MIVKENKWHNYFNTMRNKYNMRVSPNKPLVIFLESKEIDKNSQEKLEKTVKYFTKKFDCISIFKENEVSFIFENAESIINEINNDKTYKTHDIISIFSQYFFEYYNNINNKTIYWYGKCFTILKEKINSYIKYKKGKLYKNGNKINIQEYLKGNIIIENQKEEKLDNYFNLKMFDDLL